MRSLHIAALATTCACTTPPRAPPAPPASAAMFSGEAALEQLETWLAYPRGLGHPERGESIEILTAILEAKGATVRTFAHDDADRRTGEPYRLVEIVATFRPHAPRQFILATHFDTRPWADASPDARDHDAPVPGANDGTSGLAVLLELVPHLRELPAAVGFSVVLFDGEELGHPAVDGRAAASSADYCRGSRYLGRLIRDGQIPELGRAEFGIVLDMVGDRDLRIRVEPSSARYNPEWTERVWATAARLGFDAFDPTIAATAVLDDHRFLTDAGIPSILVIDREYAAWHTTADTLAGVSATSLEAVGETLRVALSEYWHTEADAP